MASARLLQCEGCKSRQPNQWSPWLHHEIATAIDREDEGSLCLSCVKERIRQRFGRDLAFDDLVECDFNLRVNGGSTFDELAPPSLREQKGRLLNALPELREQVDRILNELCEAPPELRDRFCQILGVPPELRDQILRRMYYVLLSVPPGNVEQIDHWLFRSSPPARQQHMIERMYSAAVRRRE